jgi:hypothetical protein
VKLIENRKRTDLILLEYCNEVTWM